jgi:sigma-B regulation protein RsbU (phosphoserine phosphatase)
VPGEPPLSHPLLADLTAVQRDAILARCEHRPLSAGQVLVERGQAGREVYFLLTGRLRVCFESPRSENGLLVEAGQLVGEMSVIEGKPTSAWVVAAEPSQILVMPEQVFWESYLALPEANRRLMQFLISRVRATSAALQAEFERKVRYEQLQRDLESAGKIQMSLLPTAKPLVPHGAVEAHALIRPARDVGGDFYDALMLDRTRVCAVVGDVSGKGMPAALFMVRVITLLRAAVLLHADPADILPSLNRQLCEGNDEFMFVTLALLILDLGTGKASYLNAGHNPPAVSLGGAPFRIWDPPKGALLGVAPKASFAVGHLQLATDDAIVLYTDGVTEAENASKDQFGEARLLAALSGRSAAASDLGETVDAAVAAFVGSAPQSDDLTLLALRWRGPAAGQP